MGDNTEFDLNDLPEEVLDEIATGEVFTVKEELTEAPAPTIEESIVVEEPTVKAPKATKKVEKKEEVKAPGMYHNGRLITSVPSRLGKKWVVVIDGQREKVRKSEIEFVA